MFYLLICNQILLKEFLTMSIDPTGLDSNLESSTVELQVLDNQPLIKLGNAINWRELKDIVIEDLKKTTSKLKWYLGRKLILRIHLAVFILYAIKKFTDRGVEEEILGNAIYQVFCGRTIIPNWKCPDHTNIEKFRNRLSPETQRTLTNYVTKLAEKLGFTNFKNLDIDSTAQEANMAYPSDASLLSKLGTMSKKVISYFKEKKDKAVENIDVNIKEIKKKAAAYFFMAKNTAIEKKQAAFKALYEVVKAEVEPIIDYCKSLTKDQIENLPWNIRKTVEKITENTEQYFKDVLHFIKTNTMKKGKMLSFHLKDVACIIKGKAGKAKEFGRVFQLGRLIGNFFIVPECTSIRMGDKKSLIPIIQEHQKISGSVKLEKLATDKGYYSPTNIKDLKKMGIDDIGIQRPKYAKYKTEEGREEEKNALRDHRAGIEPLIGHAKQFGLGKSKAKSDMTMLASGYRSIMAFNLHQLMGYLSGGKKKMI